MSLASINGSAPTKMDIFATLRHYNAEDKEILYTGSFREPTPVVRGWLRVSHRAATSEPVHSALPHIPKRSYLSKDAQPVELDTVYTFDVEFWPTNVVIEQGGRLVLELAACDNPTGSPHPPVGLWTHSSGIDRPKEKLEGLNRVHIGPGYENWLKLPVVPPKEGYSLRK
jgi:hypothetical protein